MPSIRKSTRLAALGVALVVAAFPLGSTSGAAFRKQPAWGSLRSPLRPGAEFSGPAGSCTFNFVFYRPGTATRPPKAYIGTAGHCTEKLGERVRNPGLGVVGRVVYDSDLKKSEVDFSLIALDPKIVKKTNPTVFYWGGPTRAVAQKDLAVGDQVDVYGYGIGVGATEQTRHRFGVLSSFTDKQYQANMPAVNGDSGAPLIHDETGAALGIISQYGLTVPPSTDLGPLVPWILQELKAAGFNVKLALGKRLAH